MIPQLNRQFQGLIRFVGVVGLLTLSTTSASAATFYVSTSGGQVGEVNQSTGNFAQVASGIVYTDIALSQTGDLFGIDFQTLYKIDTQLGTGYLVGSLGASLNGLGFTNSNDLYGTGGSGFYKVNAQTGQASLVSTISGFNSSGDIVYDPTTNRFLATSVGDSLWSIKTDGTASKIGNIGFVDVYGLAFDDNGTLFGYTANRQQIAIDINTGVGIFKQNVVGTNGEIWGSASSPSTGSAPKSVPEFSSALGLLAFGLVGGAVRRRYRKN